MRPLWKDILAALWLGILVPGITLHYGVFMARQGGAGVVPEPVPAVTGEREMVCLDTRQLPLEAYVTGVVLGEMPASFHEEALKAQAVAARTYARKSLQSGKHGSDTLCSDSGCCQAYSSEEDYLARGGSLEGLEKVRSAVQDTEGLVLTWQGEIIDAVYFSSSGGSTEAALAVWGTDYPYLQPVESPGEQVPRSHCETLIFSPETFRELLQQELPGSPVTWFGEPEYTEGGGLASVEICGRSYTGVQLRSALGLRSTRMEIRPEHQRITVITQGNGHRVGMSQYGAQAMAEDGSDYRRILAHYYPGTVLQQLPLTEEAPADIMQETTEGELEP